MAMRTVRRTGELVGVALLLAALIVAGVIGLVAVLQSDDDGGPAAAAPATMSSPPAGLEATSSPRATPTTTPTTTAPPTTAPANRPATKPSSSPVANTVPPRTKAPVTPKAKGPITYVVKRGDNLTVIAEWFKQRGYGKLYEQNRRVIGNDPDLIKPGQRITVSSAGMTTSR